MEAGKSTQHQLDLAAYHRNRYNRLLLAFKLFFISLTLITLAIIAYLIQSESSSPPPLQIYNPVAANESETFNLSLQSAAQQLERAASLTNSSSCRQRLQIGTLNLREAIRMISQKPSGNQRVQMGNWIAAAEESIDSCLDDPSAAPDDQVWAALIGAAADLRDRGDFLLSRRAKMWRWLWKGVSDVILENMIVVCACGLQMLFVFFLFWKIVKSP